MSSPKGRLWHTVRALALGQLISLSLSGASFASSFLANKGVDAPVTQSLVTYVFLALVYGAIFIYRGQKMQVPWYWYILLGLVDVEGNYFVVKAYQYTSITSITLLDCWTIAWALILTSLLLKTKYTSCQFLGAGTCITGLALVILSDASSSNAGGSSSILGDILVIIGTIFYGFSNVGEEFFVKKKDQVEAVMMLGVFGSIISLIQLIVLEMEELESLNWSHSTVLLFLFFGVSQFSFYTFTPFLLKVDWLYYVAFAVVVFGLCIYSFSEEEDNAPAELHQSNEGQTVPYVPLKSEDESGSS